MSREHEGNLAKQEPEKGVLAQLISRMHDISERVPLTRAYKEQYLAKVRIAQERCIQEDLLPDLEKKGLLGVHQLEVLPKANQATWGNLEGEVRGGKFLFPGSISGEIEGETRTVSSIQFAWRTNNEAKNLTISEIPVDKFVFKIDGEAEKPLVEFHFDTFSLIRFLNLSSRYRARRFPHPNDYFKAKFLTKVVLTLDRETYQALPFPALSEGQNQQEV